MGARHRIHTLALCASELPFTAVELSDDEASEIVRQIEQSSGRRVEATRRVDPDLLGGVVLQVGSLRLDASLRGRLERLRRELAPT